MSLDPLCLEGKAYAKALAAESVTTIHRRCPGAIHGFITMAGLGICTWARNQGWADMSALASRSLE
jgi:acetyl esterase